MTLESNKTLGGVGALLVVIGFLGFFGSGYAGLLILVGAILTLIALKGFSDHYNEGGIFNNALYSLVTAIVGVVAFIATIIIMVIQTVLTGFTWTDPMAIQQYFMEHMTDLWSIIATLIIAFVVLFVFFIVTAIFARKSLSLLSAKTGEKIFETAGLLWLIGAVLTIIAVGLILIWVAWILIAVGFFSIKTQAAQQPLSTPQPPQPPP